MLEFVGSARAEALAAKGTSCPDHFLRTKIKPLYVPFDPRPEDAGGAAEAAAAGRAATARDYAAYYERCKRADSPAMRDPIRCCC